MQLDEMITMFLSSRKRGVDGASRACRPKTLEVYQRNLGIFREYMTGLTILSFEGIRKVHMTGFFDSVIAKREAKKWSLATAYQLYGTMKSFLRWVTVDDECLLNDLVKTATIFLKCIPKIGDRPKRENIPQAADIRRFKNSFNMDDKWEYRDYVLTCLMIDTGLRAGEAANLLILDIKFEEGRIFTTGKTGPRTINTSPEMLRLLKGWLKKREVCPNSKNSPYVFVSKRSPRLDVDAIGHSFRKHCKKHGLPNLHAHLFRHAYATNYLKKNGNIENLRINLGHKRIDMVLKYSDLARQGGKEAREELNRITLLKDV